MSGNLQPLRKKILAGALTRLESKNGSSSYFYSANEIFCVWGRSLFISRPFSKIQVTSWRADQGGSSKLTFVLEDLTETFL